VIAGGSLILTYHSLDSSGSIISIAPGLFRRQMRFLADSGKAVPLTGIGEAPGSIAITFDDGFRNFYRHGFPVLQEYRIPATVFVVSGYCGKHNDWPSQPRAGIPQLELMNWPELQEVARYGISLGAHTVTHPRMSALSLTEAEREMRDCRSEIEQRTGYAVKTFAYPYGDCNAAVRRLAAQYFDLGCSTDFGRVVTGSPRWRLPRIDVYYLRNPFWFERMEAASGRVFLAARGGLRALRQRLAG
jgi:peptidoglycan/xylan/chitin deacetylase (PgdA/CDA1 family)